MTVMEIGKTEEGRPELTAIITSPENQRKLPQIKEANRKLALAEASPRNRRTSWRRTARPSSGSTAACTRPKCSARSS